MDKFETVLWQVNFERNRNWLNAIHLLEDYMKEAGPTSAAYEEIGSILASRKLFKRGIDMYQKALDLTPDNQDLLFKIGNAYLSIGELGIALYYYNKISDPYPEVLYNKAIVLGRQNRAEECAEILQDLLEQGTDSELPYYFLVEQLIAQKLYDRALEYLNRCEQQFGLSGRTSFLRGVCHTYNQHWLKAYIEFQRAEKTNFRTAGFFRAYGIACEKIGKTEPAIEYLLESIKIEPFTIATYLDLINIYIAHERLLEAHRIVEHAKQIGPFSSALSLIHSKILHLIRTQYGSLDILDQ
jgi:tetratricopeptide (TPR) repeat protein